MEQFVKKHNLPKLAQKEMNNLNRLSPGKQTESIIDNLANQKGPGPDRLTGESHQIFEKE